jgi:large conductance mechanosensitive channel
MIKEFRDFVLRGNVLDLAVAVVMGAAFTAIINSLVNDILMPIIGAILGGLDFTTLAVTVGSASIAYGKFIQAIINFLLIALALFFVVKWVNAVQKRYAKPKEAAPAGPPEDVLLLREIRDALKQR